MRNIIFNIILMLMITNIGAVTMDTKKTNDMSDYVTNITIEPKIENVNKVKKAYANINKRLIEEELARIDERKRMEEQKRRDEECYYDPNNVTVPSGISVERIYELLEGTTFQTWEIANLYYEAERTEPKINALFNIAIARQESGHGKSPIALNKNNVTSIRLGSGDYKYFASKYDCINETNNLLKNSYLVPNGDWFMGYSSNNIGYHYYGLFDNENWSGKIDNMVYYIRDTYPINHNFDV